jgi:hypothetical protein
MPLFLCIVIYWYLEIRIIIVYLVLKRIEEHYCASLIGVDSIK